MTCIVCIPSRDGLVVAADRRASNVDTNPWRTLHDHAEKLGETMDGVVAMMGASEFAGPPEDPFTFDMTRSVAERVRLRRLSLRRDENLAVRELMDHFWSYAASRGAGFEKTLPRRFAGDYVYGEVFFEVDEDGVADVRTLSFRCKRAHNSALLLADVEALPHERVSRSVLTAFGTGQHLADALRGTPTPRLCEPLPDNLSRLCDAHRRHVLDRLGDGELDPTPTAIEAAKRYIADVNAYLRFLSPQVAESVGSIIDIGVVDHPGFTWIERGSDVSSLRTDVGVAAG